MKNNIPLMVYGCLVSGCFTYEVKIIVRIQNIGTFKFDLGIYVFVMCIYLLGFL